MFTSLAGAQSPGEGTIRVEVEATEFVVTAPGTNWTMVWANMTVLCPLHTQPDWPALLAVPHESARGGKYWSLDPLVMNSSDRIGSGSATSETGTLFWTTSQMRLNLSSTQIPTFNETAHVEWHEVPDGSSAVSSSIRVCSTDDVRWNVTWTPFTIVVHGEPTEEEKAASRECDEVFGCGAVVQPAAVPTAEPPASFFGTSRLPDQAMLAIAIGALGTVALMGLAARRRA